MNLQETMAAAPQKYMDALSKGDLEGILALYADDAMVEDPVGTPVHVGKDALRKFYQVAVDFKLEAALSGQVRVAGKEVAFPFQCKNPAGGIVMHIIDVFKFNDAGKVISMKAYWGEKNAQPL